MNSILTNDEDYVFKCENKKMLYKLNSRRFQFEYMSMSADEEIEIAKQKHRSEFPLERWYESKYYKDSWCKEMLDMALKNKSFNCPLNIDIEDYNNLSLEEFQEKYEKLNKPCIIENGTRHWPAAKSWTFENLYNNFKDAKVKIGEDDEGYRIKIKLKYFLEYLIFNKDDSPLYLFESSFENNKDLKVLMKDYEVPKYFRDDLFDVLVDAKRPPHKWFLIGPERSGTTIHVDPLGTSAWNASLVGYKLWLLLPPEVPAKIVKGKQFINKGEDDEAIHFFRNIFPRMKSKMGEELKEMIFIQKPGDIVFVPGGWWHTVVNITDSIAVTQNLCSPISFPKIWRFVRKERRNMAIKFLKCLKAQQPNFFELAMKINSEDNVKMMTKEQYLNQKRNNNSEDAPSDSDSSSSSSSLNSSDFNF